MFRFRFLFAVVIIAAVLACSRKAHPIQETSSPPNLGVVATAPSPTIETPPAERNLSSYAFGGRFLKTDSCSESPRCQRSLRGARNFVWNHWHDKERAYIIVTCAYADAGRNAHIFIEPDNTGAWRVVWRWEDLYGWWGTQPDVPEIRSIQQKRADETDIDLSPGTRYLVLLDASGNEVGTL